MPDTIDVETGEALKRVTQYVQGSLGMDIDAASDDELRAVWDYLVSTGQEIILRANELAAVLQRYAAGAVRIDQLARWGAFVYHGYPPWRRSARKYPLPIRYEPRRDDVISEVLSQLEQIGDEVDGDFDVERANLLLERLKTSRAERV